LYELILSKVVRPLPAVKVGNAHSILVIFSSPLMGEGGVGVA
jgi:hypothetical protein